ncbi:ABC transporter ATP-binding protein [bacterium]|nr:ABC transporter ATP-binding protein [bacterium]
MIKKILQSLRQYRTLALVTPVLVVVGAACELLVPLLLSYLIDHGVSQGDIRSVWLYSGAMLAATLAGLGFSVAGAVTGARASAGLAHNLRADLFARIQEFSFRNLDQFSPASLITRMTTDVNSVQNAFSILTRMAIRAPANLLLAFIICLTINPSLSLIYLAVTPFLVAGMYWITTHAHPHFQKMFALYDDFNLVVEENLRGIRVVKTFVREQQQQEKFNDVSARIYETASRAERLLTLTTPLMEASLYICMLLIAWFGAHQIVAGSFTIGQLMSMVTYTMQILISLMMMSMMMVMIVTSRAAAERVVAVLETDSDLTDPAHPRLTLTDGRIEFKNVNFSYTGKNDSLCIQNVNLTIPAGSTIGIIGDTGSGKTSLVQLIPRLYDVTSGQVLVGGHDVRAYSLATLRTGISMVLQKNVLFGGTIRENLHWGQPCATQEQLEQACRQAQIHDFITSLPQGYDSPVEQGGTNFSGGQRQRLCLARALLRQPRILILDDATSALDSQTEKRISRAWQTDLPDTTVIIIAQRLSSVQNCDQIAILHQGRLAGLGTHAQLLKNNRVYQEIYASQAQGDHA